MRDLHYSWESGKNVKVLQFDQWVLQSGRSPRVNGKIVFRQNGFHFWRQHYSGGPIRYESIHYPGQFYTQSSLPYTKSWANSGQDCNLINVGLDNQRNLVLADLQKKVASVQVNLLDLFRTRVQSFNMIVKRMKTLVQAYRLLKKGNWRGFCRQLGFRSKRPQKGWHNIPNLWLEYWYGWAPLIDDCYNIATGCLKVPHVVMTKTSKSKSRFMTSKRYNDGYRTGMIYSDQTYDIRHKARCHVKVNQPLLQALSQYGVLNPSLVVWEAIPFSFVVDWFVPIGDFLESLNSTAGLIISDMSVTSTVDENSKVFSNDFRDTSFAKGAIPFVNTYIGRSKIRKLYTRFPSPLALSALKGPMDQSAQRFSYAFSLMAGIFGRR